MLSKYFFAFDSFDFDNIKSDVYGYTICKNNDIICISNNIQNIIGGCYIIIEKHENNILIKQDDLSMLSIYYYYDNNYWAISNSFYSLCKLLKSKNKKITINNLYIDQYIQHTLNSHACNKTMVNEIFILPCFSEMILSKNELHVLEKHIDIESVELDSKKGVEIIDNWIKKWSTILNAIYKTNLNIQIDLSGGFDSRVIFSLANYAISDLNSNNINIYSKIGKTKGMIEHLTDDFIIANQIADKLDIKLNNNNNTISQNKRNSGVLQYNILKNLFMFCHKEGYLCTYVKNKPMFHFGGISGEVIRRHLDDYTNYKKRCYSNPLQTNKTVIDEFINDLNDIEKISKTKFERNLRFYLETDNKHHFGTSMYNDFISNIFLISPFNDKELLKLKIPENVDPNIIFAIIIYKTTPDIFDIDFQNCRKFNDNVKIFTKELCKKYKNEIKIDDCACEINFDLISQFNNDILDNKNGVTILYDNFIKNKNIFIDYFGSIHNNDYANDLYNYANEYYLNKENFHPEKWILTITSIIELLVLTKK